MTAVLTHNPDIISIANMTPDILPKMVKTARELGFEGPIISACIADPTYALEGAGATMANDIVCLAVYALGDDVPAAMKDVVDAWNAKYPGEPFSSDALWAYDELWVLAQVMEEAQSLDPEEIMRTIESMDELGDIETTFGSGYFGGEDIAGIGANHVIIRPLAISLIKDGEITNVLWPLSEVGKGL
jgi:branched-chain amino acid transport system substrate-binding protein